MRHLQVPSHLLHCDWAAYELSVLATLTRDLQEKTGRLEGKLTSGRVHNARISLRRFQSVCRILDSDGLRLEEYELAKKQLNGMRKSLGKLRDLEILIELAQSFELQRSILKTWELKYADRQRKAMKQLDAKRMRRLLKNLEDALRQTKRPHLLFRLVPNDELRANGASELASAYDHLEPYLAHIEETTKAHERGAFSPIQLHELRIEIKSWRYFLTEFYGLTNLQLIKAQQVLGKVHDLDRMLEILNDGSHLTALGNDQLGRLNNFREKLLGEFGKFRKHLPYGLRPSVSSRAGVPEPIQQHFL